MTKPYPTRQLQFYLTAPSSCPYLEGRQERKVFTHLDGEDAPVLNNVLTHAGFRRSQSIVYRPACEGCTACVSARIPAQAFKPSKSQRRVARKNIDLLRACVPNQATDEQYAVLRRYLDSRHGDGGMASMDFPDYALMVADTPTRTHLIEYRTPADDRLIACALVDRLHDGLSLVYSFFEPDEASRSLGSFMILDHVAHALAVRKQFVYLGYWVKGSPKMDYKAAFRPLEVLRRGGWRTLDDAELGASE